MPVIRQSSFSGGEIMPRLHARTDLARYQTGLRTCRNFLPTKHGAALNRPGTTFVAAVKTAAKRVRLLPFVYSRTQSYVLEFGDQYLRFHSNAAPVVSGGVPYELVTPYLEAQLAGLDIAQVGDVLTITHPSHAPRQLTRSGHTSWALAVVDFSDTPTAPVIYDVVGGTGDATHPARELEWVATAVRADGRESLPSAPMPGWLLYPFGVVCWPDRPATVYITAQSGVLSFNVYKGRNRVYGYVGTVDSANEVSYGGATRVYFKDDGLVRNEASGPPQRRAPFRQTAWATGAYYGRDERVTNAGNTYLCIVAGKANSAGGPTGTGVNIVDSVGGVATDNDAAHWQYLQAGTADPLYPAVCGYYQQRSLWGLRETVWTSQTGNLRSLDTGDPPQADDAITFGLAAAEREELRAIVGQRTLYLLTNASVWQVTGGDDVPLTPGNLDVRRRYARGAAAVRPLVVDDAVLYVVAQGCGLRELREQAGGLTNADLSVLAQHLVVGHALTELAWAAEPWALAWAIRDDGLLLSLTYEPGHDVWGWARHDSEDGAAGFESVCVVPEGGEDVPYFAIRRTVGGSTVRYVERLASRVLTDVRNAVFSDSTLSFDGRNSGATTLTVSGASYAAEALVTVTASVGSFATGDVGDHVVLGPDTSAPVRLRVTAYQSSTAVSAEVLEPVPAAYQATATTAWAWARDTFSGLGHLEGKVVTVNADGSAEGTYTVSGGSITIATPAVIARVGLPIVADLETLDVDVGDKLRQKLVTHAAFEVEGAQQLWAGQTLTALTRAKTRLPAWGPPDAVTETVEVAIATSWNQGARVALRLTDPLPLAVLSILREVRGGD